MFPSLLLLCIKTKHHLKKVKKAILPDGAGGGIQLAIFRPFSYCNPSNTCFPTIYQEEKKESKLFVPTYLYVDKSKIFYYLIFLHRRLFILIHTSQAPWMKKNIDYIHQIISLFWYLYFPGDYLAKSENLVTLSSIVFMVPWWLPG